MKLWLAYGSIFVIFGMGAHYVYTIRNNIELKAEARELSATVETLRREAEIKESINLALVADKEALEDETNKLRRDLGAIPRTQVQRDCDTVSLPAGYADQLQDYLRNRIRLP